MEIILKISRFLAFPLLALIWIYQRTLSPDHGPLKVRYPHGFCRFYPSCSEYARIILKKEGIIALPKIIIRIIKCNPLSSPKVDMPKI